MIRKIITINEEKCTGCGLCVTACHEGAIGLVNGKAKLMRDDYCDGLGDCLPACPTGAISFTTREAAAYDEAAVLKNKAKKASTCNCPSTHAKKISHEKKECVHAESRLGQWPVQIKLVNPSAQYLDNAHLLISADCCAYAYGNIHNDFIDGKITLIGCPKLDDTDYSEKLTEIIKNNNILSITVLRMEVPCCGGIETAAKTAINASGKNIPFNVSTVSINGEII